MSMRRIAVSSPLSQMMQAVQDIPPNGWWHSDGEDSFIEIGRAMLQAGMPVGLVLELLERAYGAVAGEFGG